MSSCAWRKNSSQQSPQLTFDEATKALRRGQANQAQAQAEQARQKYGQSSPVWASKFLILEAQAALERGSNDEVLKILPSDPLPSDPPDLAIPTLMLRGIAKVNKNNLLEAERLLTRAQALCEASPLPMCGYVLQGAGLLATVRSDSRSAEALYTSSLDFARSHGDSFLEANALLNLGAESLTKGSYDEAIDRSGAAYQAAKAADAGILELVAQGNIGWAYYKLGDGELALAQFLAAEKRAGELEDAADQGVWLTNAGYVYMDSGNFPLAEQCFRRALNLEKEADNKEHIYNAYRALAQLSLQTGDLDHTALNADEAISLARKSDNEENALYPLLIRGQVAARRGNLGDAKEILHEVESNRLCPVFLKWEAQHSLGNLYENDDQPEAADRQYRQALATFEAARSKVRHEDFQLSFLANGWRIYDDYIHFLVGQGKTNDALRWADQSRARTLSEGLGYLKKETAGGPPPINASAIAGRSRGAVLYYWLGKKQSYLWAITPQQTKLFTIPSADRIDPAVERYRAALAGPQDVLSYGDSDGRWLYSTLVGPAQGLLNKDRTVFVIPDGSLNNLNFETLLVEGGSGEGGSQKSALSSQKTSAPPGATKLHYWIEDATVSNASSLLTLGASNSSGAKSSRRLLMLGDGIPSGTRFPALPHAASQMNAVAGHFPARQIFSRESATPAAYLDSHPEQFSHIHFVAHGTASRLSPLDSAIILSPATANGESFKLYGRDIIRHPLRAELVTVSSCNGSGDRAYKGEGLVGLSWAFLRAGAHNVVAALWEVEDSSAEKLMMRFYEELDRGATPAAALRVAKLSLLRSEGLSNPFYWAPFQLYTQTQGTPVGTTTIKKLRSESPTI